MGVVPLFSMLPVRGKKGKKVLAPSFFLLTLFLSLSFFLSLALTLSLPLCLSPSESVLDLSCCGESQLPRVLTLE